MIAQRFHFFILGVILLLHVLLLEWQVYRHHLPIGDETEYLNIGASLAAGDGYISHLRWLIVEGVDSVPHPDATRAPFLPVLVAVQAKITGSPNPLVLRHCSIICSVAVLIVLFFLLLRFSSVSSSLAGVFLLSINPVYVWVAPKIVPEVYFLFIFFTILLVLSSDRVGDSGYSFCIAGLLCGLAGFVRPNGILLVLGVIIAVAVGVVSSRGRVRAIVFLVVAYYLIRLPWYIYSWKVFGNPLYSELGAFIWIDTFSQAFGQHSFVPTMWSYLEEHSIFDLLYRYGKGLAKIFVFMILGNGFSGERHLLGPFLFLWVGIFINPRQLWWSSIYRIWVSIAVVHVIVFAWIGMGGLVRYLLPVYPLLFVSGLSGIEHISPGSVLKRKFFSLILFLSFFAQLYPLGIELSKSDVLLSVEAEELYSWLESNASASDVTMAFPDYGELAYRSLRPVVYIPTGPFHDVVSTMSRFSVRFFVVSTRSIAYRPSLRDYWHEGPLGELQEERVPSFLVPVFRSSSGSILVYERNSGENVLEQ